MRFADVSLADFGCYRNARLDDLPDGLGVVAGPQRAGKTTFTQAVRQLPFGIGRGDDLPPAAGTHELAATVVHEESRYALRVSGEAAPRLDPLDGAPPLAPDDLVGGLTKDRYRQLFAVGLAELRRRPDGVESEEQLSEILLGAAYGDVSEVPALREEFAAEAKRIGGKHGRAVTRLRDPVEEIEAAVADREAAKETVDEYEATRRELDDAEARLAEIGDREASLAAERTRLSILRGRFDDLREYRELRAERAALPDDPGAFPADAAARARELVDEIEAARAAVDAARAEVADATGADDPDDRAARLLDAAATVERYERRVEKWRGELEAAAADAEALDEERDGLRRRVRELRADWSTLEDVRGTPADELTDERVREVTTRVESVAADLDEVGADLAAAEEERATLAERLDAAEAELEDGRGAGGGGARPVAVGGAVALVGLLVGAAVGTVVAPVVGYAAAGLGVAAGFAATLSALDGAAGDAGTAPVRELRAKVDAIEADVAGLERSAASLESELAAAEADLDSLRDRFDLPGDASPEAVRRFYDAFTDLRADVLAFDDRVENNEAAAARLDDRLREVAGDLAPLVPLEWDDDAPREHATSVFQAVEAASEAVAAAEALAEARATLAERRAEAAALLADREAPPADGDDSASLDVDGLLDRLASYRAAAETAADAARLDAETGALADRLRSDFDRGATVEAFEPVRAELEGAGPADEADRPQGATDGGAAATAWAIPALERLADEYATAADVDARLDAVEDELDELDAEREALRTDRAELNERLERLASDGDLREAEARIQSGREQLRSLGEDYAAYRIAEHLLDRLHDRFLEAATGPLLAEASEIFARITDEYDGVAHGGDLDALEFLAHRDGAPDLDVGALSRATAEQLFLSVRLARIRQFDPPLPVVVDDALTNFDPAHARRTLAFLDELARTHQVLLLTCHPELVRLADEVADVEGYWRLDDGRFAGPDPDPAAALALLESPDAWRPT